LEKAAAALRPSFLMSDRRKPGKRGQPQKKKQNVAARPGGGKKTHQPKPKTTPHPPPTNL